MKTKTTILVDQLLEEAAALDKKNEMALADLLRRASLAQSIQAARIEVASEALMEGADDHV